MSHIISQSLQFLVPVFQFREIQFSLSPHSMRCKQNILSIVQFNVCFDYSGRFALDNIYQVLIDALLTVRQYLNHVIQWCAVNIFNAAQS